VGLIEMGTKIIILLYLLLRMKRKRWDTDVYIWVVSTWDPEVMWNSLKWASRPFSAKALQVFETFNICNLILKIKRYSYQESEGSERFFHSVYF
jgi:hypothetical protein